MEVGWGLWGGGGQISTILFQNMHFSPRIPFANTQPYNKRSRKTASEKKGYFFPSEPLKVFGKEGKKQGKEGKNTLKKQGKEGKKTLKQKFLEKHNKGNSFRKKGKEDQGMWQSWQLLLLTCFCLSLASKPFAVTMLLSSFLHLLTSLTRSGIL